MNHVRFDASLRYDAPIFLLSGRYDRRADAGLARDFVRNACAPKKSFTEFAASAHSPTFEEPGAFRDWLRKEVRDQLAAD